MRIKSHWTNKSCAFVHPLCCSLDIMIQINILTIIGIIIILVGLVAFNKVLHFHKNNFLSIHWSSLRNITIIIGLIIGVSSWLGTSFFCYSFPTTEGGGRVIGIPFYIEVFDPYGPEDKSQYRILSTIGNALFWFLLPQIILLVYGLIRRKSCLINRSKNGTR